MTLPTAPGRIVRETTRLRLREFTEQDAAFILELVNEPEWLRFIGDRNVHSLADAQGYIARGPVASYAQHGFGLWAVDLRATAESLGMCGLIRRDSLPHADLGFAFLARHRGHGYAREAAAAAVALAREAFHLPRLLAITDPDNSASRAVLEHAGFAFEREFTWSETGKQQALYTKDLA
jgi:RimJ/RimL family protein N-acetyltransferase